MALPFALVAWAASVSADRAGSLVGASLAVFASAMQTAEADPEPFALEASVVDVVSGDAPLAAPAFGTATSKGRKGRRAAIGAPRERAIRVSAEVAVRLANSGARPRGVPVRARGQRPSGILLAGVSALGVGLRDGDVLVEAAGKPATAVAEVVQAVLAARSARASHVSGRFWRDGELWWLVVEQPYPEVSEEPQILHPGHSMKKTQR